MEGMGFTRGGSESCSGWSLFQHRAEANLRLRGEGVGYGGNVRSLKGGGRRDSTLRRVRSLMVLRSGLIQAFMNPNCCSTELLPCSTEQ